MKKLSTLMLRGALMLLMIYISVAATIGGATIAEVQTFSLGLLVIVLVIWLIVRLRRGWQWSATPLDVPLVLWLLAFGLSLVANTETWRRITIGLWYAGLYIGVWYLLWDALANRALSQSVLIDLFLICGLIVLVFGCYQLYTWSRDNLPAISAGVRSFELPRPVSTIGNANAFGTFLAVLLPFALIRALNPRNALERLLMLVYVFITLLLLIATYSRGAWFGAGVGLLTFIGLQLAVHNLLSKARLQAWWTKQRLFARIVVTLGLLVAALVLLITGLLFLQSFSAGGRSTELRTDIWGAALSLFGQKPLTGTGLFTFGRGLMSIQSIPPMNPHSHAHSVPFNVLAELGLVGLAALVVTAFFFARAMRRNWQTASSRTRLLYTGAIAGSVAFAGHHLLDTTAMTPAIALTGLLAVVLAVYPSQPVYLALPQRRIYPAVIAGLGILLVVSGFWSSGIYQRYTQIMNDGLQAEDYGETAAQLQLVIDADPGLGLYHMQQAYLYGLAAYSGDLDAVQAGISAYRTFLGLEPYHAVSWANLSVLLWQVGEREAAVDAMEQAQQLAPRIWQFAFALGTYAEEMGNQDAALTYYRTAAVGNVTLYPAWEETALRQQIAAETSLTPFAQTALLLEAGDVQGARANWEAHHLEAFSSAPYQALRTIFALADGDRPAAASAVSAAWQAAGDTPALRAWARLAAARLAIFDNDYEAAAHEIDAALALFEVDLGVSEDVYGLNFAVAQYLRIAIPRQYLPHLYYPTIDPLLLRLLNATASQLSVE